MKRTNVILDETLLEEARRDLGEKTYSATITKALESVVKRRRFWEAYDKFAEEAAKGDFFWPGYLEEIRPPGRMLRLQKSQKKARVAAHEKRAPREKSSRRGSR
jgi:putative antitoxin of VapBC-like toxin-antitoxin system